MTKLEVKIMGIETVFIFKIAFDAKFPGSIILTR
jgi:hypothetical protein